MTLQIFLACISPRLPAREVKSWAKANTGRPPHQTVAGNHPVRGNLYRFHAEIDTAVGDEHVDFAKRAGIEQAVQSLPSRQLALFLVFGDGLFAAHLEETSLALLEILDPVCGNTHYTNPFPLIWFPIPKKSNNRFVSRNFSIYLKLQLETK